MKPLTALLVLAASAFGQTGTVLSTLTSTVTYQGGNCIQITAIPGSGNSILQFDLVPQLPGCNLASFIPAPTPAPAPVTFAVIQQWAPSTGNSQTFYNTAKAPAAGHIVTCFAFDTNPMTAVPTLTETGVTFNLLTPAGSTGAAWFWRGTVGTGASGTISISFAPNFPQSATFSCVETTN